jgi:hypothetical protein
MISMVYREENAAKTCPTALFAAPLGSFNFSIALEGSFAVFEVQVNIFQT